MALGEALEVSTRPRFKAFISYSLAADGKLAPRLQSALQSFAKPWYTLRACRVFRDETSLATTPALWPAIERALLDSEYFILLASPKAAESPWVSRELERWCEAKTSDRLLIVLTEGTILWNSRAKDFDWPETTALPPCLTGRMKDEPLYLDARWMRTEVDVSRRHPLFVEAVADLSATLRGLSKDELIGQDVREHKRTRRIASLAAAALLALAITAAISFVRAKGALKLAEERQVDLATKLEELGNICVKERALACAQRALEQDLQISRELHDQFPKNAAHERGLSVALVQAGEMMLQKGDFVRAHAALVEAVALIRKQTREAPIRLRDLSVALMKLGDVEVQQRSAVDAQHNFDEALQIRRTLLARSPDDVALQLDVAIVLGRIGSASFQLQNYEFGLAPMKEAISFYESRASGPDATATDRRELAINLYDLSGMQLNLGRLADARDNLLRSIELLRITDFQSPISVQHQELFQSLRRGGLVALKLDEDQAAAKLHSEACALSRRMPDNIPDEDLLALILDLSQIVDAHSDAAHANPGSASECVVEGLRRLGVLSAANPSAFGSDEMQRTLETLRHSQAELAAQQ
jgi:tetratricopeptide (TPR) repeat protein